MNYKKKILILSFLLITSIQLLLLINNKQKTSFRYFIWDIEEVSIGRLIFISFFSGILMSTMLNKTLQNNIDQKTNPVNLDENNTSSEKNIFNNADENKELYDMPPERDLRDTQPTISVNYRVINDNGDNEFSKNKTSSKPQYNSDQDYDDWNNPNTEW